MDMHADYSQQWEEVLAMYEDHAPNSDLRWQDLIARYAELTRELLKCRGIVRLPPHTSMMRLCLGGPGGTDFCSSQVMSTNIFPSGEFHVVLNRRTPTLWGSDSRTLLDRTCTHVRSAVRAIRVAARLMGVTISQPPREQTPAGATRRQWLVISKDGLFAPPRAKVYRELRLDGFAFEE